jgi:hypothetical protein
MHCVRGVRRDQEFVAVEVDDPITTPGVGELQSEVAVRGLPGRAGRLRTG